MDFQKELEKHPDLEGPERQELEKLVDLQKDVAVGQSAEDFVRHPFFKVFENKMNDMINDSKNKILDIKTTEELKAYQAGIAVIKELKGWINSYIMRARIGRQAIEQYEKDTTMIQEKIQEVVDRSAQQ